MRRLLFSFALCVLAAAVPAAQPAATLTAIRAGRLLDPEAGQHPHQPGDRRRGEQDPRRRPERAGAGWRAGDRSLADDGASGSGRSAQPSRADLQAGPREQHLLLHLRAGIDGAARDPGGVERHADARLRLHHRPRHGQQRQLRGHGAAAGDRAGMDPRADDHQLRHHHRRHGRAVLSDARDGEGPQHRLPGVPRRRHARRDRQGDPPEHPVRRQGDQDLRRLQALRLHRGGNPARHRRGREVGAQGRGARADAAGREERDRGRHLVDRALRRASTKRCTS